MFLTCAVGHDIHGEISWCIFRGAILNDCTFGCQAVTTLDGVCAVYYFVHDFRSYYKSSCNQFVCWIPFRSSQFHSIYVEWFTFFASILAFYFECTLHINKQTNTTHKNRTNKHSHKRSCKNGIWNVTRKTYIQKMKFIVRWPSHNKFDIYMPFSLFHATFTHNMYHHDNNTKTHRLCIHWITTVTDR